MMKGPDTETAISTSMRKSIDVELGEIAVENDVRILFAIESGSRAWGFPSPDSDYDVRFVYVRPVDWYLSITPGRDVIERPISDDLDISGWDIQKALGLLLKPNPVMLEWMSSPIRYIWSPEICDQLIAFTEKTAFTTSCLYHYLHLGKGQWRRHLDGRETLKLKKYFYILRPAMAICWLRMNPGVVPPMNFQDLVEGVGLTSDLSHQIETMLEMKSRTREIGQSQRIPVVDAFIREQLDWAEDAYKEKVLLKDELRAEADHLFRSIAKAEHLQ